MADYKNERFIKDFGKKLRAVRKDLGISQEKLCELSGLTLSQIGRIERAEINTSLDIVKTIADALKVNIDVLFQFESNTQNNTKLTSKEVMKKLSIKSCDLMHLREDGTLRATKNGNTYLYYDKDVESLALKSKSSDDLSP